MSTAAAPPPTVTRETARAPKTRGLDPYNVTPALGGRLVDNQKFSDYDPSSPRANMQATLENNRQRVNTVEKTDLPARPSTYGGYSFNQSSALQAAAVDSGLVGSIDASYGIDPSPVRPAAPQAVNAFKAQAVPDEALPGSHLTPAADEGPLEVDIPGYPSAPKYSFPDYSVYNNWDATKAGLIASKAIRDAQAENILDVENYYDPASDGPISGPDVPPSEAPSQEGWWEGDVPPSQREPLVDKSGWPNRVFNGASRLLDNFVPGAGWGMRKMKDASIDRINQMSPAEQALMKERWDRERDAYVRGDIGPGRGGNRSSPLASLLGSNNGYIPPGATPMPDTGSGTDSPAPPGATPPDPWKRRRVGNPADPYTYGYGPAYNYFTYGS